MWTNGWRSPARRPETVSATRRRSRCLEPTTDRLVFVAPATMTSRSPPVDEMRRVALIVVAALAVDRGGRRWPFACARARRPRRCCRRCRTSPVSHRQWSSTCATRTRRPAATRRRRTRSARSAWRITPTCSTTPRPTAYRAADRLVAGRLAMDATRSSLRPPRARRGRGGRRAAARDRRGQPGLGAWRGCGSATRSSSARATAKPTRRTRARRRRRAQRRHQARPRTRITGAARNHSGRPHTPRWDGRASRSSRATSTAHGNRSRTSLATTPRFGAGAPPARRHLRRLGDTRQGGAPHGPGRGVAGLQRRRPMRWSTRWRANRAAACCCSSRQRRPIWWRDAAWREYLVRRALEFDGANPDVVYEMGALLQQLKRPREALPYFERHLDMVSDDQQTLVQIGKCYADLGRFKEAEAVLRRAVALSNDAVGVYNLGYVLEQVGRGRRSRAPVRAGAGAEPGAGRARTPTSAPRWRGTRAIRGGRRAPGGGGAPRAGQRRGAQQPRRAVPAAAPARRGARSSSGSRSS